MYSIQIVEGFLYGMVGAAVYATLELVVGPWLFKMKPEEGVSPVQELNETELGNVLLTSNGGRDMQSYIYLDSDRVLAISYRSDDYPCLHVCTLDIVDEDELAEILRTRFNDGSWVPRKLNVVGADDVNWAAP